jgi:hypothetical protein
MHVSIQMVRRALMLCSLAAGGALASASPAAAGNFVIGSGNAVVGAHVTFWGAQWWKDNSLAGEGAAPPSFKGFANTVGEPLCGTPWTTDPGNSSDPPEAPLPETIDVLVTSAVTKSGRVISGNAPGVALVRTEPGYEPDPGHPGTGMVLAILCPEEGSGGPR